MSPIFSLAVDSDRVATLTFDLPDKKANILNRAAIEELERVVAELASRADIGCLLLVSGKPKIFIAGADIEEIRGVTDPQVAIEACHRVHRLYSEWERLPYPTVAAVRGTCLGGGTELALACTYLLVSDRADLRIGLPEIKLGILPAWGGCTRLPRRIGIAAALDIILQGKAVPGRTAFKLGLADALLPDAAFERLARDFALGHRGEKRRPRRRRGLGAMLLEGNALGRAVLFSQARKKTLQATKGHYPAPLRALDVIRTGVARGPAAGFAAEAAAVGELATSAVSKNLVHLFLTMEDTKKAPGLPGGKAREVRSAAVLGAGVMGGGIAQLLADQANLPVRLRDVAPQALAGGMAHAAALFRKQVERRRLADPEAKRRLALIHPTLQLSGLGGCDLVIEAIVEKLEVKQQTFAELGKLVAPEAILASNTSSLSIDLIARDTPHPERVVGMHFFNPVDKMPLVEVVVGRRTGPAAVNTIVELARRLGKTPVVVRDGPGFLVNRLLCFYMAEALHLLSQGHAIEELDSAMLGFGMPMGPVALVDEVGIDVAIKVAHILAEPFGDRLPPAGGQERIIESGRLGAKNGRGFYRYDGRRRTVPDPEVYALLGITARRSEADAAKLVDRMVLPMVNEAARCLAEGVVATPADLDLAMIFGTGFPPFRGGLCRWADQRGLADVVGALERLQAEAGARFAPSAELREAQRSGGFYARDWRAVGAGRRG